MNSILALGDCNTLGVGDLHHNSFPERTGNRLGAAVNNCGCTMATTREGLRLVRDNMNPEIDLLLLQFGLVDSYLTVRYAPYVLYYPDNWMRKQYRSIVKSYKKFCRRRGISSLVGTRAVVDAGEYERNVEAIIAESGNAEIMLIETIPHKQEERNVRILQYNSILATIASRHSHVRKVSLYYEFRANFDTLYCDDTHCNSAGHSLITDRIMKIL